MSNHPSDKAAELARRLIRNFNEIPTEREIREPLYDSTAARLAAGTAARKLGASIDTVAPGKRACPYHFHHAQEEMFVVLEGSGTLRVAGEMLPLRAGDVVFIPPGAEYPHQIINTSDAPLKYLSISTREFPEICEYPDSNKYLAMMRTDQGVTFDALQRKEASLDYWDGEP
ncbi:MAG TPA: cupin domain-containing protein [Paucimonas sp.]|nr:cupin domain-containing protein [Paucimonas sp.]